MTKKKQKIEKHYYFMCDLLLLSGLSLIIFCASGLAEMFPFEFEPEEYFHQLIFFMTGIGLFFGTVLLGVVSLKDWNIKI